MEAKLAEYRARKLKEQRQQETVTQRFLGLFRKTGASGSKTETDEKRTGDSLPSLQQDQDPSKISGPHEEEQAAAEDRDSPPQKCSWLLFILKVVLWFTVWLMFIELQFGAVFFAVSALVFVYANTRTGKEGKRDSLSAYSVFNPNCERLQGTITAEQLEANLLHRKTLAQS